MKPEKLKCSFQIYADCNYYSYQQELQTHVILANSELNPGPMTRTLKEISDKLTRTDLKKLK